MLLHGWSATSTRLNGNAQLWVRWVLRHMECTRAAFQIRGNSECLFAKLCVPEVQGLSLRQMICRHIRAVMKSSAERRRLATEGGIGNKWRTDKFQAFTTYAVRAPCEAEVFLLSQQNMFPSKVVMPELRRQRGRPETKRALSQGEKYHGQGVKRANLPEGSSVVICGQCGRAGHNHRTCPVLKHFHTSQSVHGMFDA